MAQNPQHAGPNFQTRSVKAASLRLSDVGAGTTTDYVDLIVGDGVPSGGYGRDAGATMLYFRKDASSVNAALYITVNGGTAWTALSSAAVGSIADTNNFYTTDTINGALDALGVLLGATTDTTYNFTNGTGTRLTDNDTVYAALNKLDQGFVDLKSTANAKGASLVGIEDSAALITATTAEAALAELATYPPIALADPGTGQPIPVTRSASIGMTFNGSETNTLAIPTFLGQQLLLYADTATSGSRVITSDQAVNQAANSVMTFAQSRDFIYLVAIKVGGAFRWQVAANDGVALS